MKFTRLGRFPACAWILTEDKNALSNHRTSLQWFVERKETCLTPFHSLVEWWDVHPRHLGTGAFPGKESSVKLSWVPLQGIGAGGRVLLLPISMCCVCPSFHVAGKGSSLVPSALHPWGDCGLTASSRPVTTGNKAQSPAEMLRLLCSRDWALTLLLGRENSLESTMIVYVW